MVNFLKKIFSKGDSATESYLPDSEKGNFYLQVDGINIGVLSFKDGFWEFHYTQEFKDQKDKYSHIVGFPDLDREYKSENLWPFFLIRIPGLKQPAVQKIIKEENIDQNNEVALLKRFGKKSIANPYELSY